MRKLTHEELLARQARQNQASTSTIPFCAVLNDIRSLYNVGSIFRTADGVGMEKLWLCGITGRPPHSGISKTALGAEIAVPWEGSQNVVSAVGRLKSCGYEIALLEQMEESIPHGEWYPDSPTCLIVGNEVTGVSEELVSLCDVAVDIEMVGLKNSLNVSVAFGVVAYHVRNCLKRKTSLADVKRSQ
jgi:23S rRNA (guanosine2251-2'-O)-methyltransferase